MELNQRLDIATPMALVLSTFMYGVLEEVEKGLKDIDDEDREALSHLRNVVDEFKTRWTERAQLPANVVMTLRNIQEVIRHQFSLEQNAEISTSLAEQIDTLNALITFFGGKTA